MDTHSARVKENKKPYHYNACKVRHAYKRGLCEQKRLRAEKFEGTVWSFVFGLLKDPERLRAGMNALIEAEFAGGADPGTEADGRVRDLPPLHLLPDAAAERAKTIALFYSTSILKTKRAERYTLYETIGDHTENMPHFLRENLAAPKGRVP
jgi:hypothetical protein